MAKAFSEHEREIINEKLITSCEECWNQYGYQKTSIRDLCSQAGISSGAFYLFYESKELLFIETAARGVKRILSIIDKNMPPDNRTKEDFAKEFKLIEKEIENTKWLLSIEDDFEIFKRKLPPETFRDFVDLYSFQAEKYGFSPAVSPQTAKVVLGILLTARLDKKSKNKQYDKAYGFIIDTVIDRLFD
ncbi:MAG: TetR/AcrR family transcriptional regulator [Spirochaetaceae bacterium]|jgi:AcrR family transcriptional regulator|nr:TetR/AcrR family transcriptional regulator [Spirochaetaceae bacterium]